jgi:glycosyltransferase involved in cell wall biosynthesis
VNDAIDLTIVMPCLNEADTLGGGIEKARLGIERSGVRGRILVADNGSVDHSVQIAEKLGARVIHVKEKGYGNAFRGGIQAASGKRMAMGDADDSYDATKYQCPRRVQHQAVSNHLVCLSAPKGSRSE